jgi:hypothetical protein
MHRCQLSTISSRFQYVAALLEPRSHSSPSTLSQRVESQGGSKSTICLLLGSTSSTMTLSSRLIHTLHPDKDSEVWRNTFVAGLLLQMVTALSAPKVTALPPGFVRSGNYFPITILSLAIAIYDLSKPAVIFPTPSPSLRGCFSRPLLFMTMSARPA